MMHTRSGQREQLENVSSPPDHPSPWSAPAGVLAVCAIAILALPGIGARYSLTGGLDGLFCLFSLFFSTNLLICYWEICLFLRRNEMSTRAEQWRQKQQDTGRTAALQFLTSQVPLRRCLSPSIWADVWASYSLFDSAYRNRRTYGFSVDVANGIATPASTLVLYIAFCGGVMPAIAAGLIGVMIFWQWTYITSLYLVIALFAHDHSQIGTRDLYAYVIGPNIVWILVPIVGLFVSIRLILDGNYSVIGLN